MISTITKRDGRKATFDLQKIASAIFKAAQATGGRNYDEAMELASQVETYLVQEGEMQPSVEHIQDVVEKVLIEMDMPAQRKSIFCIGQSAPESVR